MIIIMGFAVISRRVWAKDWTATGTQEQLRSDPTGPPSSFAGLDDHSF